MDLSHLHHLAVEAMRSRGPLPAFTPHALQEAAAIIRDLRHLTWLSIDNDDTRDLDQLSVAEPLAAGAARWTCMRASTEWSTRCSRPPRAG